MRVNFILISKWRNVSVSDFVEGKGGYIFIEKLQYFQSGEMCQRPILLRANEGRFVIENVE